MNSNVIFKSTDRILLTSDIHFENNKNLPNIIKTCNWISTIAEKEKTNYIIIAGDFINSREKIDSLMLNKAIETLNLFNKTSKVILLLGNHEKYTKAENFDITSIRPFEKHSVVVDRFKIFDGETLYLYMIPYIESPVLFDEIVKTIYSTFPTDNKKKILIAHQEFRGAITNDLFHIHNTNGIEYSVVDKFDIVISGHYHRYQTLSDKITYLGSPLQLTFGEEGSDKGIMVMDCSDCSTKFIKNPYYECYKTVVSTDEDVKDKFVRFWTDNLIDDIEREEVKKKLVQNGALDVRIEVKARNIRELDSKEDSKGIDLKELTRQYIKLNCGDLDENKLFEIGAGVKRTLKEKLLNDN